jgi:hypothetical protein
MGLYPRAITEYLAMIGIPRGPNSNIYLVDSTNGNTTNKGDNYKKPLSTIAAAYAKCVDGQHDVVLVLAGASGNNLSAALTWSKSYTHLVGMCAPTHAAQRARIFQLSTLTGASPLLTISGSGCIFRDFYIFQGVNDATSLINVSVTGGRNYFKNVHFAGGGHTAMSINGGASLQLNGAEECLFEDCTIGVDTITSATGHAGILFDASAQRNVFKNCKVTMHAGHAGAIFVELVDGTGFDRYTIFDNCMFLNCNKANFEMTAAFAIPAVAANRPARFILKDCVSYGAAKWDANDRGVLIGNMDVVTPVDESGELVELVT